MRSIWKGAITFGMVTIPVKLYTATEDKDIKFKLLHRDDLSPIKEKRFCVEEDKEVAYEDLVRGFDLGGGEFVVVEPTEIEEVAPESTHTIDIGDFVELDQIDPIYYEKTYFLEPQDVGVKPFTLLRRALEETRRVAVAKVAIRNKERLATIRVYDGTLVLETMYWPDEIRSAEELETGEGKAEPGARERQMARTLVETLSDRFRPEEYTDQYRIALQELIERKMKGETRNAKRRRPEAKVVDLMAALEASLAAAKGGAKGSRQDADRTAPELEAAGENDPTGAGGDEAASKPKRARKKAPPDTADEPGDDASAKPERPKRATRKKAAA